MLKQEAQEVKEEKTQEIKTDMDEGKNFKRLLNRKYGTIAYDIKTEKRLIDCKAWHWKHIDDSSALSPIELDFIQELVDRNNLAKLFDMTYELHCAEEISPGWKEVFVMNKITLIQR